MVTYDQLGVMVNPMPFFILLFFIMIIIGYLIATYYERKDRKELEKIFETKIIPDIKKYCPEVVNKK